MALEAVLELALEGRPAMELYVACWRLLRLLGSPPDQRLEPAADFAWRRPASRCFPTCSDHTHPLTAEELRASPLAQAVMRGEWAWAGIPGMRFEMQGGSAVLVTPWGHGQG